MTDKRRTYLGNGRLVFDKIHVAECDNNDLFIGPMRDGLPDGEGMVVPRAEFEAMLLNCYAEKF